jgi:hypothetical protein
MKNKQSNFFDEIKKIFGFNNYCLTSEGNIYPVTVATNMLITLIATFIVSYCANNVNLLDFKYTVAELFLTCIVFFTLWNCIAGYVTDNSVHYISTNTSLLISVLLLPLVVNGPKFLIQKFC